MTAIRYYSHDEQVVMTYATAMYVDHWQQCQDNRNLLRPSSRQEKYQRSENIWSLTLRRTSFSPSTTAKATMQPEPFRPFTYTHIPKVTHDSRMRLLF